MKREKKGKNNINKIYSYRRLSHTHTLCISYTLRIGRQLAFHITTYKQANTRRTTNETNQQKHETKKQNKVALNFLLELHTNSSIIMWHWLSKKLSQTRFFFVSVAVWFCWGAQDWLKMSFNFLPIDFFLSFEILHPINHSCSLLVLLVICSPPLKFVTPIKKKWQQLLAIINHTQKTIERQTEEKLCRSWLLDLYQSFLFGIWNLTDR